MSALHTTRWCCGLLAAAVLLSACASAPDTTRTAPTLPAAYPGAAPAAQPAPIAADWWTLFGDARLTALVQASLQHNADLQLAASRVDETAALLGLARAAQWPGLDLQGAVTRSRSSALTSQGATAGGEASSHRLVLSSSFEIDLWGKLRQASAAAQAQLLAAEHARDAVRVGLAAAVAQSYFGLRSLDAQIAVLAAQAADRDASLKLVQRRLDSGLASTLERAQALTALAATRAQQPELARQRALLAHQLGLLSGQPGLVLAADADALPAPLAAPAGLPSELLLRRPDLRQAEAALRAADAQVEVARMAMWPTLSLSGHFGGQSADLVDLLKGGARVWSIGPSLLLPLFDGGRSVARTDQARAQAEQAAIGYRQAVWTAFTEVADALAGQAAGEAQAPQLALQAQAADEALRIAQRRFEAGYSGYLEVLDAQRGVQDARLAALRLRQARLDASVALLKALGGGWTAR